jgi:uncharacterized protein YdaU (DUF1376 family)
VIHKSLIADEWRKRRTIEEKRARQKQSENSSSTDNKANSQNRRKMRKSFMRIEQTNQDLLSFTLLKNRRQSISPIAWGKHMNNQNAQQTKKVLPVLGAGPRKPSTGGDLAVNI